MYFITGFEHKSLRNQIFWVLLVYFITGVEQKKLLDQKYVLGFLSAIFYRSFSFFLVYCNTIIDFARK